MTPFLHFRMWWRRAPLANRSSAALSLALAVALAVWIALPTGSNQSSAIASADVPVVTGPAPPAATPPSGAPMVSGSTTGPTATASTGAGVAPAGTLPTSPAGTLPTPGGPTTTSAPLPRQTASAKATKAPTVSASPSAAACARPSTIKVGVVLDDVAGLNHAFGIGSPSEQQGEFAAMLDAVNKTGAAGCVTLTGDFQTYNEFDTSTAQSACLAFQQNHDFAVMNGFLPTGTDDCPLQHHIPLFEVQPIGAADIQKYYPYYFSSHMEFQVLYRNYAYATQQMGIWKPENGFKKLGILYRDCQPDVNAALLQDLAAVGVTSISKFDVGCPDNFAAPPVLEQAITQFKRDGVTHAVFDNDIGDVQNFTKLAQQQGFKPKWVLADHGMVEGASSPGFQPDPNNFDGALAITPDQYGQVETGLPDTAGTKACDAIMTAHGQGKVHSFNSGYPGVICNTVWMFAAALKDAPSLTPTALVAGLNKAPPIDFSFPFGPNSFSKPGTTFAGQYWRSVTFHKDCACFKVDDPTFKPSF